MCREVIYFCAELLNYWSMTFFGLKLFAKVYEISVHRKKGVENLLFALMCLPMGILGAVNYACVTYSIFMTYVLIVYMYIIIKLINREKTKSSLSAVALYFFVIRLIDLWLVTVIIEVNIMSRFAQIEVISQGTDRLIYLLVISALYYVLYLLCLKSDFLKYLIYNKHFCGFICLYSFLGNSCFNGVYRFEYQEKLIGYWIFYLVCAFLLIGSFFFYIIEIKVKEKERLLSMRNDMMESNYTGLKKAYEQNRTLQHDYKNHLLAINEYIKDNKTEEALEYIYRFMEYTSSSLNDFKSGNDIVDIILNSKIYEVKEKNINFVYEIDYLADLPIENIDLCALMANLLDNSIEACEKVMTKETEIYLKIVRRNALLLIQLINSIHPDVRNKHYIFKSEKENSQLHGWGMKSIERVIEKYGGTRSYNIKEDTIEIFITISL